MRKDRNKRQGENPAITMITVSCVSVCFLRLKRNKTFLFDTNVSEAIEKL